MGFASSLGNIAKGGDAKTESFSSSFSSSTGPDGKLHKESSKKGSETKCHGGVCKVTTCADGKCKEVTEKAEDAQKEAAQGKGAFAAEIPFRNMERSIQNEMGHMGDIFKNIRQQEKSMFDGFNHGFPKLQAGGANSAAESFSSASEEVLGKDGKVHKRSQKEGAKMKCSNGTCTRTVCKDGKCKE